MLRCDWCHRPISGEDAKGWAYEVKFTPFHSLTLAARPNGAPANISLPAHVHTKPCKDELAWAIQELLREREPLETDGPSDDAGPALTEPARAVGGDNPRAI